jgi:hypothetical protein
MASKKIGVHGTDAETGRAKANGTAGAKVPDIGKDEFLKSNAVNLAEALAGRFAAPKEFSTGSYGYHLGEKVTVMVAGKPVKCQANVILTVINSKPTE